jgi:hypothetical protein
VHAGVHRWGPGLARSALAASRSGAAMSSPGAPRRGRRVAGQQAGA